MVEVILLLLSRNNSLVIDNKINRERGIFKLNMDIRDNIDQ